MDMFQDTESGYVARSSFDSQGMNPTKEEVIARYPNAMILKSYISFNLRSAIVTALESEWLGDEGRRLLTIINEEFLSDPVYVDALATEIAFYEFMHKRNKISTCSASAAQEYITKCINTHELACGVMRLHSFAYFKALEESRRGQSEESGFGGRR